MASTKAREKGFRREVVLKHDRHRTLQQAARAFITISVITITIFMSNILEFTDIREYSKGAQKLEIKDSHSALLTSSAPPHHVLQPSAELHH